MRRNPGGSAPLHNFHLLSRLVQASRRIHLRSHHGQQECLGVRVLEIHHAVDYPERLHPANHDQHELNYSVVLDGDYLRVLREDV